jgi:uncharacterized repeat protein (TIGR03803 family)
MALRFRLQFTAVAIAALSSACAGGGSLSPERTAPISSANRASQMDLRAGSGPETILHEFAGKHDSGRPTASLIAGASGALFGASEGDDGLRGGSVFELTLSEHGASERVIHQFKGKRDGALPASALLAGQNGTLFGTTLVGGSSCEEFGCGVVFELTPNGNNYDERILHAFGQSQTDGTSPDASVTADSQGSLYGTTTFSGAGDVGTVYKLTSAGSGFTYSIIYAFGGGNDAEYPMAPVVVDAAGSVFGTTFVGGSFVEGTGCGEGCGAVFQLVPSGSRYKESVIYNFQGSPDGAMPFAGLLPDGTGAFYGTTSSGGVAASSNCPNGCGTVFKLTPAGSGYAESVLYRFQGGTDGNAPKDAVIFGSGGVLYGTTSAGGAAGLGTIFSLTPSGSGYTESVVYSFKPAHDGAVPDSGLLFGSDGRLFGTTTGGGKQSCPSGGCGTVFALTL